MNESGGQCNNCGVVGRQSKETFHVAKDLCEECYDFIYQRQNFKEDLAKARVLEERRAASGWRERRQAKKQVMYAGLYYQHDSNEPFFGHISESIPTFRLYDEEADIYEVEITIHEDQTREKRSTGFGVDYWAWIDANEDEFCMVQPSWGCFSMQFPGGGYGEQDIGRGHAYRVQLRQVRKLDGDEQGE